ncbi:MAG: cytochrome ubiquinol oxidase subunit I [Chlamydiae bacterium]|nr:cytochrome ubiquinol oxidase subunit I [Chlamydiota bacterium]
MDVIDLARLQFAFTITYHYIFPPMSIGILFLLVIIEGMYLKTKIPLYLHLAKFWTKIFALFFVMGVASGFVQLFAFGNNWSQYSRFVGDIFGGILAAEGVFAFFLEAGFIGIMLFGWGKVRASIHYLSTVLVCFGATFSATWIVMANSWMQTPDGYRIVGEGAYRRAVITDLWKVFFNPSFVDRIIHVLLGCLILGVFLLLSVSAYYLVKRRHIEEARFGLKLGLPLAGLLLFLQLLSADSTAEGVGRNQPVKLAAMEGMFTTETPSPMYIIGWPSVKDGTVKGIKIPGLLSLLYFKNLSEGVKGLDEFPKEDWPDVFWTFQSYHIMIYCWGAMTLLVMIGLILQRRKKLEKAPMFLWMLVFSIIFPYVANTTGWFTAEIGRQPWIVQGIMRIREGASTVVSKGDVIASLIMFVIVYSLLFSLFIFLLNRKIKHGPVEVSELPEDIHYRDYIT